jgi:hypothetical protein
MSIKTHDYETQAGAFAGLEMQGTHYLAFRDIPMLIREYAGSIASVLGCRLIKSKPQSHCGEFCEGQVVEA